jgi:L-ascorbate metabolism protein UlaG (beta-lactamase superfamily)
MKNKDCLVMGKHMPHRTDLRRDDMFKGLNFRVVIRNKDDSIYHSGDKQYMKYHNIYNATESKLFNVGMFDFI